MNALGNNYKQIDVATFFCLEDPSGLGYMNGSV